MVTEEKSELKVLLEKNAKYGGLTKQEEDRIATLIANAQETDKDCALCGRSRWRKADKAIAESGLCRGHTLYELITREWQHG